MGSEGGASRSAARTTTGSKLTIGRAWPSSRTSKSSAFSPVTGLMARWASPALVDTVAAFSVVTHFDGFQKGVVDSRDLLFFLSVIGFSLFATGVVLRNR